ncbi:signal transducer and activator of transcription 1-alpha/beta-like isoform 2-T2 [Aulostomus maculatus]
MSQWQQLLRLDSALQGRVSELYKRRFSREIRHCLSGVIESQDWDSAAEDGNKARTCFSALLQNLEEQWNVSVQENKILQGPNFPGMKDDILHFKDDPLKLAVLLSECLREERVILASAPKAQGCSRPAGEGNWEELNSRVEELRNQTLGMKTEIKALNEQLDFTQATWQSRGTSGEATQPGKTVLRQMTEVLKLAQAVVETLTAVELCQWKRRQQMACIGSPADTSLDLLQKWFTSVTEVLQEIRRLLQELRDQNEKYQSHGAAGLLAPVAEMEKFTLLLLRRLLTSALVVEQQPVMMTTPQRPLILKTGVRFTATVRFLVNLPEFKCLLKVQPVFDKDTEETKTVKGYRRFEFARNSSQVLDGDAPGGALVAEFGQMTLKGSEKKGKESPLVVTEELHRITFVTEFHKAGLTFNIEASSLPVVVICGCNQAPAAWASIMWFNMLSVSEPRNLLLFMDPPPLTWPHLSQLLSWQFLSVGKRQLDGHQLAALREKFVDDANGLVHWKEFSKKENTWIWINGILDLIKKHLVDLWRDGYIMGFVSKERTRLLLQEKKTGTFLLRFSESNKDGAISFSWVEHSNGETSVHNVDPYTKKELSSMSLPNIINRYSLKAQKNTTRNPLLYLYPDIHKDTAFGRYHNASEAQSPVNSDGYLLRKASFMSCLTPPPSPPQMMAMMDVDPPTSDMDVPQLMDLHSVFASSDLLPFYNGDLSEDAILSGWSGDVQNNCFDSGF